MFDWMRLESGLPFDKIILERGRNDEAETDDCVHVQYSSTPRRLAYIGQTHGRGKYTSVEVRTPQAPANHAQDHGP